MSKPMAMSPLSVEKLKMLLSPFPLWGEGLRAKKATLNGDIALLLNYLRNY